MNRPTHWPIPSDTDEQFNLVLAEAGSEGLLGYDIEFGARGPHIAAISSKTRIWASAWDADKAKRILSGAKNGYYKISAYSGITADKPETEEYTGIATTIEHWSDAMLRFFLCHPNFAAAPGKDEDDDDQGALGLYNLFACSSMYLDLPQWKQCRGIKCYGPCPSFKKRPECPVDAFEGEVYYCGIDAYAGLMNDYALIDEMQHLQIPDVTYERLKALTEYCWKMQQRGVKINLPFARELDDNIVKKKLELFPFEMVPAYGKPGKSKKDGTPGKPAKLLKKPVKIYTNAPFNPNSPQAVTEYFETVGIALRDRGGKPSASKTIVVKALNKQLKRYGAEYNVRENAITFHAEDTDADAFNPPEHVELLLKLAQSKGAGKGISAWVNEKYITNGKMHPRFNSCGASTGRLSSSRPNFQNWPKHGFGTDVRKCVISDGPEFDVVRADLSQLELRICVWYAKMDPYIVDGVFEWMVEDAKGLYDVASRYLGGDRRAVAKSVSHASSYLEGLSIRSLSDLNTKTAIAERDAGALTIYDGTHGLPLWKYRGGIICFTGGNLSERLFGDRTRDNRRVALELRTRYFERLHYILEWQMRAFRDTEESRVIRSASGKMLRLLGTRENDLKLAAAFLGQNGGAEYAQEGMLRFAKQGIVMRAQVHDEYVFTDIPISWTDDQVREFMQPMVAVSEVLPGFVCPAGVNRGPYWKEKEMKSLGKIGEKPQSVASLDTRPPRVVLS